MRAAAQIGRPLFFQHDTDASTAERRLSREAPFCCKKQSVRLIPYGCVSKIDIPVTEPVPIHA